MATTLNEKTFAQLFAATGGLNGTRVNEQGKVVAAVAPAFEFDPATLAPRGLSIRGLARTNLCLNSQVPSAVGQGTTPPTVANATVDGEAVIAATFTSATVPGFAGNRAVGSSPAAITSGTTYSSSAYIKLSRPLVGSETIVFYFTGASAVGQFAITPANSSQFVDRLTRVAIHGVSVAANGSVSPHVYAPQAIASNLTVWFCKVQLEAADYASTYIPTTTATVTRTVESIFSDNVQSAPWFNKAEGTMLVRFLARQISSSGYVLCLARNSNGDRIYIDVTTTSSPVRLVQVIGGATAFVLAPTGPSILGLEQTAAISWKAGRFAISVNGGTAVSNTYATLPDFSQVSRLHLGSYNSAGPLEGEIRDIAYWPKAANAAELSTLTPTTEVIAG